MTKHQAKPITQAEARHLFLNHLAHLVKYWEEESRAPTSKEKLEGLVFSILVAIDGGAMGLPGYKLIPRSNPTDIAYAKEQGFDYDPEEPEDITLDAELHGSIHSYLKGQVPKFENLYDFGAYLADEAKKYHGL